MSRGSQSADQLLQPALDTEVLDAVRDLKHYPRRRKEAQSDAEKQENALAMKIAKTWERLLPNTRCYLESLKEDSAITCTPTRLISDIGASIIHPLGGHSFSQCFRTPTAPPGGASE